MREIKFRAWDEWDKSFDYMSLNTLINGYGDDCADMPDGEDLLRADMVEQFTGLRDKNGREIYEGDIVKTETVGNAVVVFGNYELYFDDWGVSHSTPGFVAKWDDGSGYAGLDERFIVIGNIHETPELLK